MMNRAIFVCLIVISAMCVNAQPVAKSTILGGGVSMYFDNEKVGDQKDKAARINIHPMAGYFVNDRIVVGLEAGVSIYNRSREDSYGERKRNESLFNVSPFLRYYLTTGTFGFFTEGSCNVGFGKLKEYDYDSNEDGNLTRIYLGISPGIYYYIHPKIALELSAGWVGYMYDAQEIRGSKQTMSRFGFDLETTGLSLGVTFTL